jgi:hypothetical protein
MIRGGKLNGSLSHRPLRGKRLRGLEGLERRDLMAAVDSLRITELMYQPAPVSSGAYIADDFEYIELMNTAATPISLNGVQFVAGVTFNFTGSAVTSLAGGERVLVVKNIAAFQSRYGGGHRIAGQYDQSLSNSQEQIYLQDGLGNKIHDFNYADHWHKASNGDGFSLTVLDPRVPESSWGTPQNWRASLLDGGSPGAPEPTLSPEDLLITEVLAHTDVIAGDQLEVYNRTNRAVNISGWYLSDDPDDWNKYRISDGKIVPAGGYLVFNQDQHFGDANDPNAIIEFGFSELGEEAHLASWDSTGTEAVYHTTVAFLASDRESTLGRHVRSDGSVVFVEMATNTMGRANTGPKVGPIVINEIMYNLPGAGRPGEFIELRNISNETVSMFHPTDVNNRWRLITAVTYTFPPGTTIAPGAYALVVADDPATFRANYDVPANVQVFGPYTGNLSDIRDSVDILRPGNEELTGFIPRYMADLVEYNSAAPWPAEAAGGGHSLVRVDQGAFGNDVANWTISALPGGTPGRPNSYVTLPGDTNDDGRVDLEDLNAVRNHFGASGANLNGDANDDGQVDLDDLNLVRNHFGATSPAPVAVVSAPTADQGVVPATAARSGAQPINQSAGRSTDVLATARFSTIVRKSKLAAWDLALERIALD